MIMKKVALVATCIVVGNLANHCRACAAPPNHPNGAQANDEFGRTVVRILVACFVSRKTYQELIDHNEAHHFIQSLLSA